VVSHGPQQARLFQRNFHFLVVLMFEYSSVSHLTVTQASFLQVCASQHRSAAHHP
jgi:hypothetical protein